jgi:hypothetical protein
MPSGVSVTPYTAPEVALEQCPADTRSDIFSFGAIVFEILTGRPAFAGDNEAALAASLCSSPTPSCGRPAIDRLIGGCLAKHPGARWQSIQKIALELKLGAAAARRANTPAPLRLIAGPVTGASADIHHDIRQIEARMAARLQAHEQSVSEAMNVLRAQLAAVGAQLAVSQGRPLKRDAGLEPAAKSLDAFGANTGAAAMSTVADLRQSVDRLNERVFQLEQPGGAGLPAGLEQTVEGMSRQLVLMDTLLASLHENVAADLSDFEVQLKAHTVSLDSAHLAMGQTDDLVERVVEALQSLQSTILEQSEDRTSVLR